MPLALQAPYLYFTLVACAVALICLFFFLRRLSAAWGQLQRKWHPPAPFQPALLRAHLNSAIFWMFPLVAGLLLLWFAFYLSGYQYCGERLQTAGSASFRHGKVSYASADGRETVRSSLKDPKATVVGIFLRFPKWLRFVGLGTYYRVISAHGLSESPYRYTRPPSEWLEPHTDAFYLFLYRNSDRLGIVDAFYSESPYFSPGQHTIFATRSGFIVQ